MRTIALALVLIGATACRSEPRESTPQERHHARLRRLVSDRSTPLCRLPPVGDTSGWRRVPAPDALLSMLLPASFVALPDSPPRFWHGGYTWRDGPREFMEFGVSRGEEPPPGACRTYLRGVPIAYVTVSTHRDSTYVSAWLAGIGGLYDSELVGRSPDPRDRELFLRVITTARYDSGFFRRRRAAADSARVRHN